MKKPWLLLLLADHLFYRPALPFPAADPAPSSSSSTRRQPPPGPPWSFEASRIHYQFATIPTDVARRCIPFADADEAGDKLRLLSFAGRTLGGIFAVEYSSSPIGPYREVAVLAGLVAGSIATPVGSIPDVLRVGAWASHIFVDSTEAAAYGEKFWGLPAEVVEIDFDMPPMSGLRGDRVGAGCPTFVFANDDGKVGVAGWTGGRAPRPSPPSFLGNLVDVTLPSYSGRLTLEDPLLRYPLTISNLGKVSLERATLKPLLERRAEGEPGNEDDLQILLDDAWPLMSVNLSGATLVAGTPEVL